MFLVSETKTDKRKKRSFWWNTYCLVEERNTRENGSMTQEIGIVDHIPTFLSPLKGEEALT